MSEDLQNMSFQEPTVVQLRKQVCWVVTPYNWVNFETSGTIHVMIHQSHA